MEKSLIDIEEEILTIPYAHFDGDWDMLQVFLERRKNPPYKISGDLDLEGSSIESLGNLESVGGSLDLVGSSIKSLGNLKSVGGSLFLRKTPMSKKYTEEEIRSVVDVKGKIYL